METISFGPVFIHPDYHRKGFGNKLITYSIDKARKKGYRGIITLGYPYHYTPYGFLGGKKYNISMPDGKFYEGLLVLPLYEGAFDNISGYAEFSSVFDVEDKEVYEFDKRFKIKKKLYQKSQDEYKKIKKK